MSKESPMSNVQSPKKSKVQRPMSKVRLTKLSYQSPFGKPKWLMSGLWTLDFGLWTFFGLWTLDLLRALDFGRWTLDFSWSSICHTPDTL